VPYRGRKGTKTWNIMVSCSFDLLITFVNVGWEGSAHDTTVWSDSLTKPEYKFPHPLSDNFQNYTLVFFFTSFTKLYHKYFAYMRNQIV
jgi:hypothetical protein